ncbi:MAG TPA: hypothetical protein VFS43_08390 [Polyangiaceae bacterium]|nr:hypothetical protein [Polyangiaceae bacterium]
MMRQGVWLRALRGLIAALIFTVMPPPAAALPLTDVAALVASEAQAPARALGQPLAQLPAPRTAPDAPAHSAAPPRQLRCSPERFPTRAPGGPPPDPRERLYLLDCALLR